MSEYHTYGFDTFKTVTLVGSTTFKDVFYETAKILTMHGYLITMPHIFARTEDEKIFDSEFCMLIGPSREDKIAMLKHMGFQRVYEADIVYVINPGMYIGKHTLAEILYAQYLGKQVVYLCEPSKCLEDDPELYYKRKNEQDKLKPEAINILNKYKPYKWVVINDY